MPEFVEWKNGQVLPTIKAAGRVQYVCYSKWTDKLPNVWLMFPNGALIDIKGKPKCIKYDGGTPQEAWDKVTKLDKVIKDFGIELCPT